MSFWQSICQTSYNTEATRGVFKTQLWISLLFSAKNKQFSTIFHCVREAAASSFVDVQMPLNSSQADQPRRGGQRRSPPDAQSFLLTNYNVRSKLELQLRILHPSVKETFWEESLFSKLSARAIIISTRDAAVVHYCLQGCWSKKLRVWYFNA